MLLQGARRRTGGNFIIRFLDGNGEFDGLGANEIGNYAGERYHEHWRDTRFVEVDADGTWSAEVLPLAYAAPLDLGNGNGSGDHVRRVSVANARLTHFRHTGSSNFIVIAYDSSGSYHGLVVNEIGNVDMQRVVPSGTEFLTIRGDGGWSIR